MFVTDTIDAVYRPEDWSPESLLDQLAEMVTDLPESKASGICPLKPMLILYIEWRIKAQGCSNGLLHC
jgi:hypothetical protein